jgi:hypothetical protein
VAFVTEIERIYRVGDRFEVTEDMMENLRETGGHAMLGPWMRAGRTGTCYAHRFDRDRGHMCIEWDTDGHKTNVHMFEKAGVKFEKPEFELLAIDDPAAFDLLSTTEQVILGLMEEMEITEEEARTLLGPIYTAMERYGIVFYIP